MAGRIRTPRNFVLEERLERYEHALEVRPQLYAGRWAAACAPVGCEPFSAVHLDLGCGKAAYILECARRRPRELFVGMDAEPVCIAYAGQYIEESGLRNLVAVPGSAQDILRVFAPGELASISLNFSTPHPKARHAEKRLVHVDRLLEYRRVLAPGGSLLLRTDSEPFWLYARTQLDGAGYRTLWSSRDVRAEHPGIPGTEYERRLAAQGARTYGICASPGPEPAADQVGRARAAEQSLAAYLPDDLDSLGYIPYGMEETVRNFRTYRMKRGRAGARGTGATP